MVQNGRTTTRSLKLSAISTRPGFLGAIARFWYRSYAADYICLCILIIGWLLIQIFIEPFHRMFSLDNGSIQFPFAVVERVPVLWAVIYAGVVPLGIIAMWSMATRSESHFTHVTILGLFATLVITTFLTDIIKNAVGRPRPDLLDRCKPEKGTPEHALVSFTVCLESSHHVLHEGWRSFPSGHSSFAFGGLGYLSFFFAGQLHVFRPRSGIARFIFFVSPLLGALMIAMSRLADYRHDVYDVTCGALLGLSMAYFTYRRYYPSLKSIDCDIPYPTPDGGFTATSGIHPGLEDEEQRLYDPAGSQHPGSHYQLRDLSPDSQH